MKRFSFLSLLVAAVVTLPTLSRLPARQPMPLAHVASEAPKRQPIVTAAISALTKVARAMPALCRQRS
jgi:hypothetical protein